MNEPIKASTTVFLLFFLAAFVLEKGLSLQQNCGLSRWHGDALAGWLDFNVVCVQQAI